MKKLSLQEWKAMRRKNPPHPVDWSEIGRRFGPAIAERQREFQESMRRLFETTLRHMQEAVRPGTDLGDLVIIGHPWSEEAARLEAVQRFLSRHIPIAWQRWKALNTSFSKELQDAAESHKRSFEDELTYRALSGLFLVSQVLADIALADAIENEAELLRFIKTQLNDEVTEDILGEMWRHEFEPFEEFPSDERMRLPPPPDEISRVDAELTLSKILEISLSSEYEKTLVRLRSTDMSHEKIAEELGRTPGAVRAAFSRAMSKIRAVFPEFSM